MEQTLLLHSEYSQDREGWTPAGPTQSWVLVRKEARQHLLKPGSIGEVTCLIAVSTLASRGTHEPGIQLGF
jgi:hypothetical protein